MIRPIAYVLALLALTVSADAADVSSVSIRGKTVGGQPVTLSARLIRPNGAGPFPAMILMHGCSGLRAWGDMWGERLARWGYVVLRPDSFGGRGIRDCARGNATVDVRAGDAEAARRYLAARGFVAADRIGLMGMSHGGTAALIAVGGSAEEAQRPEEQKTFRAVVSLYPRCYQARAEAILAPILILIGENDHLAPAGSCSTLATRGGNGHPLDIVVYPKATHAFDWKDLDMVYFGQRVRYNPDAAADAVPRVRAFLEMNLRRR